MSTDDEKQLVSKGSTSSTFWDMFMRETCKTACQSREKDRVVANSAFSLYCQRPPAHSLAASDCPRLATRRPRGRRLSIAAAGLPRPRSAASPHTLRETIGKVRSISQPFVEQQACPRPSEPGAIRTEHTVIKPCSKRRNGAKRRNAAIPPSDLASSSERAWPGGTEQPCALTGIGSPNVPTTNVIAANDTPPAATIIAVFSVCTHARKKSRVVA